MVMQGLCNGFWVMFGQLLIVGMFICDSLSCQVILFFVDMLCCYLQYNEMSYVDFICVDVVCKNIFRVMLLVDVRFFYLGLCVDEEFWENVLSFEGKVDFMLEESGYGGSFIVDVEVGIEILFEGGLFDFDFVGVLLVVDDLNVIGVSCIVIGMLFYVEYGE